MGRIEALWVKLASRGPLKARDRLVLKAAHGIEGDANAGGPRPVTLLDRQRWTAAETALGRSVDPTVRRANVMVDGLPLAESRGKVLRIGTVRLRIGGETTPCRLLDDTEPGLSEALRPDWGGGAWAEVLEEGEIAVGDAAEWES